MPVNWLRPRTLSPTSSRFARRICAQHRWRLLVNAGYAVQPSQTIRPAKSSPRTSAGTSLPRLSLTAYSVLVRGERPHPRLFAVAFDSRLVDVNNVSVLNPSADLFVFSDRRAHRRSRATQMHLRVRGRQLLEGTRRSSGRGGGDRIWKERLGDDVHSNCPSSGASGWKDSLGSTRVAP